MTTTKPAPTSLKAGMPPEQHNGMFGAEDKIMALGVTGRFTAVVTFEVADIITSEHDATRRPIVQHIAIEPVWDEADITAAKGAQESAYKERTGANQLDFDAIGAEQPAEKKKKAKSNVTEIAPGKEAQF